VIAVHLRAAFLLSKLVLPEMYARKSASSCIFPAFRQKPLMAGDRIRAAKAGILGLTRVMAAEASRQGVRVNAICPVR